jgi:hypothetical protein
MIARSTTLAFILAALAVFTPSGANGCGGIFLPRHAQPQILESNG